MFTGQTVSSAGRTWPVAAPGYAGIKCTTCGNLQFEDQDVEIATFTNRCSTRGCRMTAYGINEPPYVDAECLEADDVYVRADSVQFFDAEATKASTWFHATERDNWLEGVTSPEDRVMVHVGTERTAHVRAESLVILDATTLKAERKPRTWTMYEVRLVDSAVVGKDVLVDDEEKCPTVVSGITAPYTSVSRYVNQYESVGSVSLVVDPALLEIVSVRTFVL